MFAHGIQKRGDQIRSVMLLKIDPGPFGFPLPVSIVIAQLAPWPAGSVENQSNTGWYP